MKDQEEISNLLTAMAWSGIVGLAVGIARGVIQAKHGSFLGLLRGAVASVLVAVIVSWGLADGDLSVTTRGAITGICAFIADDILLGLMSLGTLLGKDPLGFFARFIAAYRGQAAAAATSNTDQKKDGE